MADKATAKPRKAPVRKAPQRKDYPSETAWLQAKLELAQAEEAKANTAKVTRLEKRITAKETQIARLQQELADLRAERDALVPAEPEPEWTEQDHLAAEGKA